MSGTDKDWRQTRAAFSRGVAIRPAALRKWLGGAASRSVAMRPDGERVTDQG